MMNKLIILFGFLSLSYATSGTSLELNPTHPNAIITEQVKPVPNEKETQKKQAKQPKKKNNKKWDLEEEWIKISGSMIAVGCTSAFANLAVGRMIPERSLKNPLILSALSLMIFNLISPPSRLLSLNLRWGSYARTALATFLGQQLTFANWEESFKVGALSFLLHMVMDMYHIWQIFLFLKETNRYLYKGRYLVKSKSIRIKKSSQTQQGKDPLPTNASSKME